MKLNANTVGYLGDKISMQENIEAVVWLLLSAVLWSTMRAREQQMYQGDWENVAVGEKEGSLQF